MLLYERLSISDEVVKVGNEIIGDLLEQFPRREYQMEYPSIIYTQNRLLGYQKKVLSIEWIEPIWGVVKKVLCNVPLVKDGKDLPFIPNRNGFIADYQMIMITVPSLHEELNIELAKKLLFHELEHAFQCSLQGSDFKIDDVYASANMHFNLADKSILGTMSNLFYLLNQREIDANMHTAYAELKHHNYDIHTETYMLNQVIKALLQEFYKIDFNCQEFKDAYEILHLNVSFGKIKQYIDHQYKYFQYKLGKVMQRVRDERIEECTTSPRDKLLKEWYKINYYEKE